MKRREFLIGYTVAATAAWAPSVKGWAQSQEKAKLDRISVMTLAFRSILKNPAHPDDPQRTLDFLDTPELIAIHQPLRKKENTT